MIDRFPLIKIDRILDWHSIESYLEGRKRAYVRDNRGKPEYRLLPMFKAVLLGQWGNLSDPELEKALYTRIDFSVFCGFDDLLIPDHSTLCRFHNWLGRYHLLEDLLNLINQQLT